MTVYIHSSIKEEVEEVLVEMEEEAEEEKLLKWDEEYTLEFCPECGSIHYTWKSICEDCGFPHQVELEPEFRDSFLDFPDDADHIVQFYD